MTTLQNSSNNQKPVGEEEFDFDFFDEVLGG